MLGKIDFEDNFFSLTAEFKKYKNSCNFTQIILCQRQNLKHVMSLAHALTDKVTKLNYGLKEYLNFRLNYF